MARAYARAAERLGDTITGEPADDELLMPVLSLYRQALELQLKATIKYATSVRLRAEHTDPTYPLAASKVTRRLRHEHGHNLDKLIGELDHHLAALEVEPVSAASATMVQLVHDADRTGTGFRYDGLLPNERDDIEFPDLAREMKEAFVLIQVISDVIYDQVEQGLEEMEQYGS